MAMLVLFVTKLSLTFPKHTHPSCWCGVYTVCQYVCHGRYNESRAMYQITSLTVTLHLRWPVFALINLKHKHQAGHSTADRGT